MKREEIIGVIYLNNNRIPRYKYITFVGSHGTGKTKLSRIIAEKLNMPYIEEQARISMEKLNITNMDELRKDKQMFSIFQHDVLRRQFNKEAEYIDIGFVSDRSTLCNNIYYLLNTDDCVAIQQTYKNLALENYKHLYDLVIYIPIMFPISDDGVRNKENKYQRQVDEKIKEYLKQNINVYTVKADNIEDRIVECLDIINDNPLTFNKKNNIIIKTGRKKKEKEEV